MAISEALLSSIISGAAAATGAGVSAGVSSTANRRAFKWTRKMYDIQRSDYLSDREYNNPANQMQRFRDAGLNPNLIYGQDNAQPLGPGMQQAPTDSSASYIAEGFNRVERAVALYDKLQQDAKAREVMAQQIEESKSRQAESDARKDYYNQMTQRQSTLNGLDLLKFGAYKKGNFYDEQVRNMLFKNAGLNLNNRFLNLTLENRVKSVASQLRWLNLRNEGLKYDNKFKSGIMNVGDYWIDDYWRKKMMMPALQYREQGYKNDLYELRLDLAKSQKELFDSRAAYTDIKKMIAPLQLLIDLLK